MANSGYDHLISKLDAFIRKYYKNQLIRGGIYAFALVLVFFLVVTTAEYFGHFSTTARSILFWIFIGSTTFILVRFIAIPLFHLFRFGKIISHEQAAGIIGQHFGNVKDKLLNVLQLKRQAGDDQSELLLASIEQKTEELKPVPFVSAINLNENKKYLRYALLPLSVFIVILLTAPSLVKDGTQRLIAHNTFFEKPAPFNFTVLNKNLKTVTQQDFDLQIKIDGNEIPAEAYIEVDGNTYKLEKESKVRFNYTFRNIQRNVSFKLTADGFTSKAYTLEALPKPQLNHFSVTLNYPPYLQKKTETLENTGELNIPAGTQARWSFHTQNTESLSMQFSDSLLALSKSGDNDFEFARRFFKSDAYTIRTANSFLQSNDSIRYGINVIPDLYPTINVEEQKDSLSAKRVYFKGLIKDDYGFSNLTFNYRFLKSSDSTGTDRSKLSSSPLSFNKSLTADQFYHAFDFNSINIGAGDEIEYYFEVSDNDGVSGPKKTRSMTQIYKAPTLNELSKKRDENANELKDQLQQSINEARKLQKDINDLSKKLLEKKELGFEEKKKTKDLLDRQKELEKKIEQMKTQNEKNNFEQSEFKQQDQAILDKQQQLQDLMNKIMTPELKKLMEDLQKMLDTADKKKLEEQLKDMKFDAKDVEKNLDRQLELFKQLEFEQKMQENIDKLNEMAKKEDELSKQSEDKNSDNKDLEQKQDELNKEFDDFKKDMDDLQKKNEELEQKHDLEKTEEQQQDIQKEMNDSKQQLSQNQKKNASKKQKSASQKMQDMANKMSQQMQQEQQEQQEENMEDLRALIENLLHISFDQEKLMQDLKNVDINNPQYLTMSQQQRKIKDDMHMIDDSLRALSKRVVQIASTVNKEVSAINQNMDASLENLEDRFVPQARSNQQFAMTSINNLLLMLNDALNQMMQQSASQKAGKGSCKKPGGGGQPSLSQLKKMQEELNKNMAKAKEQMQKNGNKPGQKGKPGEGMGMSEQLSKMAAQQEYIRNMLNKINQQENKDATNSLGDLNEIQRKMEETENDIVNRMISEQTLRRQQDILTRLLESEKAERERDQDEQRKSEEAKKQFERNPAAFEEYKRLKEKEMELLRTVPPALNQYYKKKVSEYFQTLEN